MKLFRGIGRGAKRAMGFSSIQNDTRFIFNLGKDVFAKASSQNKHHDNVLPLKLTDDQIRRAIDKYNNLFKIHLAIFIAVFFYTFVKAYQHDTLSVIVSGALILLELAQLFRCHFLLFRLKTRHFSADFKAWFTYVFSKKVV